MKQTKLWAFLALIGFFQNVNGQICNPGTVTAFDSQITVQGNYGKTVEIVPISATQNILIHGRQLLTNGFASAYDLSANCANPILNNVITNNINDAISNNVVSTVEAIASDGNNGFYLGGRNLLTTNNVDGNRKTFALVRFNSAGNIVAASTPRIWNGSDAPPAGWVNNTIGICYSVAIRPASGNNPGIVYALFQPSYGTQINVVGFSMDNGLVVAGPYALTGADGTNLGGSLLVNDNNQVVVASGFTHTNSGFTYNDIIVFDETLTPISTFSSNPNFNSRIRSIIHVPAQDAYYCGGNFSNVGGTSAERLVRLNEDLTVDPSFNSAISQGAFVNEVLVDDACNVIVVGAQVDPFFSTGTNYAVARYLSNGAADLQFVYTNSATISSATIDDCGILYIAGQQTTLNNGFYLNGINNCVNNPSSIFSYCKENFEANNQFEFTPISNTISPPYIELWTTTENGNALSNTLPSAQIWSRDNGYTITREVYSTCGYCSRFTETIGASVLAACTPPVSQDAPIANDHSIFLNPEKKDDQVIFGENKIMIRPNPTKNQIQFNLPNWDAELVQISIYDMLGKKVYSTTTSKENITKEIDTSHLTEGMYNLVISNGEQRISELFQKIN